MCCRVTPPDYPARDPVTALVDLNGRFFGGRQVKARFYKQDLYDDLELNEHVL